MLLPGVDNESASTAILNKVEGPSRHDRQSLPTLPAGSFVPYPPGPANPVTSLGVITSGNPGTRIPITKAPGLKNVGDLATLIVAKT